MAHLEQRRAGADDVADQHLGLVGPLDGQVLPEVAEGREVAPQRGPPVRVVLDRVGVDGLVRAAVHLAVGLAVALRD